MSEDRTAPAYRMSVEAIPQELHTSTAETLGKEVEVYPAKENGSYRGPIVYADKDFLIQAVGKNQQTAVVHLRDDLEMVGEALKSHNAKNDLPNKNVQIHYRDDHAKVFPWDAEKEQAKRATRAQEKPAAITAESIMSLAEKYVVENMKNVKQREAFLKHLGNVTQEAFNGQQKEPAKNQPDHAQINHAPIQEKQADVGLER